MCVFYYNTSERLEGINSMKKKVKESCLGVTVLDDSSRVAHKEAVVIMPMGRNVINMSKITD